MFGQGMIFDNVKNGMVRLTEFLVILVHFLLKFIAFDFRQLYDHELFVREILLRFQYLFVAALKYLNF